MVPHNHPLWERNHAFCNNIKYKIFKRFIWLGLLKTEPQYKVSQCKNCALCWDFRVKQISRRQKFIVKFVSLTEITSTLKNVYNILCNTVFRNFFRFVYSDHGFFQLFDWDHHSHGPLLLSLMSMFIQPSLILWSWTHWSTLSSLTMFYSKHEDTEWPWF